MQLLLPALKAFVKQKARSQPSSGRRVYASQFGLRTERQNRIELLRKYSTVILILHTLTAFMRC